MYMPYKDKEKQKLYKREYNRKYAKENKHIINRITRDCYHRNLSHSRELKTEQRRRRLIRPGELELIENYELAKQDNFIGWVIHHRLELTINGEAALSQKDLKRLNMYFHRPYYELIYLTRTEHAKIHGKASSNLSK